MGNVLTDTMLLFSRSGELAVMLRGRAALRVLSLGAYPESTCSAMQVLCTKHVRHHDIWQQKWRQIYLPVSRILQQARRTATVYGFITVASVCTWGAICDKATLCSYDECQRSSSTEAEQASVQVVGCPTPLRPGALWGRSRDHEQDGTGRDQFG